MTYRLFGPTSRFLEQQSPARVFHLNSVEWSYHSGKIAVRQASFFWQCVTSHALSTFVSVQHRGAADSRSLIVQYSLLCLCLVKGSFAFFCIFMQRGGKRRRNKSSLVKTSQVHHTASSFTHMASSLPSGQPRASRAQRMQDPAVKELLQPSFQQSPPTFATPKRTQAHGTSGVPEQGATLERSHATSAPKKPVRYVMSEFCTFIISTDWGGRSFS